jgi:hypothetical protein
MGILLTFVATVLISIFWGGFVTTTLSRWFMVPLGVKAISYCHAVGLGALLGMSLGDRGINTTEDDAARGAVQEIVMAAFVPTICLGFGWFAKVNM